MFGTRRPGNDLDYSQERTDGLLRILKCLIVWAMCYLQALLEKFEPRRYEKGEYIVQRGTRSKGARYPYQRRVRAATARTRPADPQLRVRILQCVRARVRAGLIFLASGKCEMRTPRAGSDGKPALRFFDEGAHNNNAIRNDPINNNDERWQE